MAAIPWWLWLGIGLLVTIMSSFAGIPLFIIVGVIFMIIGIAKAVFLFVFREPKHEKRVAPQPRPRHVQHIYCPRCRVAVTRHDNFCRYCGNRLR